MDRVLAFGCHPDDIEFMAAGTLALLAEKGYEIHLATMAGGDVGSATLTSEEIREIRLAECAASAEVLGSHFHYAGGDDLEVEYNDDYRRKAVRVVREVDPLIILTHAPTDYLICHEETSRLVRNAAFIASVPLYDAEGPGDATDRFPYLYYWNALEGMDIFGRPLPCHFGVDVAAVMDTKEEMLGCHKSQRDWLLHINGWDSYTDNMKQMSRADGERIGREWGECYIQHLQLSHPRDNILKEILGDLVVELEQDS